MDNNKFPKGLQAFKPNDKAPDFIIAEITVTPADLQNVGGSCRITYRKLPTGNYIGRAGKFYFFIYKREHGKWDGFDKYVKWYTARIGVNGEWIAGEGIFGSYLKTIKKAKWWVRQWLLKNAT